ncbi:TerD family protein [Chromatium okenii]|uniref:TerD family protein n=1 Tax=Chromatium okenii TaxID=61644 RepID=UPI0026EEFF4B|nr:TerD family protein [Chromatium okenii]MBV5311185.1 SEL1-like repeat protein [Chromatium okenii]
MTVIAKDVVAQFVLLVEKALNAQDDLDDSLLKELLPLIIKSAEQGNADAQIYLNLGRCYLFEIGVPEDLLRAFQYFSKAAAENNADAKLYLARFYDEGFGVITQDQERAIELYTDLAEQGNADAQVALGYLYLNGLGVAVDYSKAFDCFSKAVGQDNAEGQFWLARCYEEGWGVTQDQQRAIELYTESAEKGHATAQLALGYRYLNGIGVSEDNPKAFEWFSKAADQNNAQGKYWLAQCYEFEWGVSQDQERAIELYTESAEQGCGDAQVYLGSCYLYGLVIAVDHSKAFEWFSKAADQNNVEARFLLAECYKEGHGVTQNQQRAVEIYTELAEQGYSAAQVKLGRRYFDGTDVPEDFSKAAEWFSKAAAQDDAQAKDFLRRINRIRRLRGTDSVVNSSSSDETLTPKTTLQLIRGQRLSLSNLTSSIFQIGIEVQGISVDFSCFALDADGKLTDDRYRVFFNQPNTPCGGITQTKIVEFTTGFDIELSRLPLTIHRMVFVAASNGLCTMRQLKDGRVALIADGQDIANFAFQGLDFDQERAVMLIELYRKEDDWRLAVISQGFNDGLDAVIQHFDGALNKLD